MQADYPVPICHYPFCFCCPHFCLLIALFTYNDKQQKEDIHLIEINPFLDLNTVAKRISSLFVILEQQTEPH